MNYIISGGRIAEAVHNPTALAREMYHPADAAKEKWQKKQRLINSTAQHKKAFKTESHMDARQRFKLIGFYKLRHPTTYALAETIYTAVFDTDTKLYFVGYDAGRLLQNDSPNEAVTIRSMDDLQKKFVAVSNRGCGC